jgi:hypothetical protein
MATKNGLATSMTTKFITSRSMVTKFIHHHQMVANFSCQSLIVTETLLMEVGFVKIQVEYYEDGKFQSHDLTS